jgi:hypothetical protein
VIIEQDKFNNSLAGWLNCPNGRKAPRLGTDAQKVWVETYLQNGNRLTPQTTTREQITDLLPATERLSKYVEGYKWTVQDTYAAQNMCPYETVSVAWLVKTLAHTNIR